MILSGLLKIMAHCSLESTWKLTADCYVRCYMFVCGCTLCLKYVEGMIKRIRFQKEHKHQLVKILAGERFMSWLFTSVA